jgi:hypothetical protein
MPKPDDIATYRGKQIALMSREELIDALNVSHRAKVAAFEQTQKVLGVLRARQERERPKRDPFDDMSDGFFGGLDKLGDFVFGKHD